jgi:hypothetical protein
MPIQLVHSRTTMRRQLHELQRKACASCALLKVQTLHKISYPHVEPRCELNLARPILRPRRTFAEFHEEN